MIFNRLLTKTAVLLFILVAMTAAVIVMNFQAIDPSDAFMMLYGGLIVMFVTERDDSEGDIG